MGEAMKKTSPFLRLALLIGVALAASWHGGAQADSQAHPGPRLAQGLGYSASGTHQCRTSNGESHSCVVTGPFFSNCIDAGSSLRTQDCCPSTRVCARDAQGRETDCQRGGTSVGFTLNYCISGGGR
jgi:hypothetical protein